MKQGFTLIELMIVVGIIGILSMLALPVYQDYTKRTYIAEGLALASGLKNEMMDEYVNTGEWPDGYVEEGENFQRISGNSVYAIIDYAPSNFEFADDRDRYANAIILIYYNEKIDSSFKPPFHHYGSNVHPTNGLHLALMSDVQEGSIQWKCAAKGQKIKAKWLPANCRDQIYANGGMVSWWETEEPWWEDPDYEQ